MKPKLIIVSGAGSSFDFGFPLANEINALFLEWTSQEFKENNINLYKWVIIELDKYISNNTNNRRNRILNFEGVLFLLQVLAPLYRENVDFRFDSYLLPFVEQMHKPKLPYNDSTIKFDYENFTYTQSFLIDKLLKYFRKKSYEVISQNENFKHLKEFYSSLREQFDIGVINLNYDNLIISCNPDLNTGFDKLTGKFRRELLYNENWDFCYHIHGSVHFDFQLHNNQLTEIVWKNDLNSNLSSNSSGRSRISTLEGYQHLQTCIIAGLDKSNQILREPFAQYYNQLDKKIFESDHIMFLGYGFADRHINSLFPFVHRGKKKRNIVIIDHARDEQDGLFSRHDDWTYGLYSTIPYSRYEMTNGNKIEGTMAAHYKKTNTFERFESKGYNLSVWYGGMLKACENSAIIINELIR